VDGAIQGSAACDSCHGFPPATGAHVKHFGLAGTASSWYGDTRALQEMFPGATPGAAPGVYGFGCGSCHPLDFARHQDGTVDVALYDAAAPAGSLKRRAAPTARFDGATGTCAGVYCHSSGQESPAYRTTPAWTATTRLGCGACHDDPPRYASGGAGSATANSHLGVDDWSWVVGHFGGVGAVGHAEQHGTPGPSEAAITCQTCHYETTDPAGTGPSGFYWLNTGGQYDFAGRDPAQAAVECTTCHGEALSAAAGTGGVLPLRHVNGVRDVVFDPRTAIDRPIPYLPAAPNTPQRPYYRAEASAGSGLAWLDSVWNGTTRSLHLGAARYDPATKTCTVACHDVPAGSGLTAVWGTRFGWDCRYCHGDLYTY
jgi:predicted CxxxxCH...CXXCH cytochrome family protein